MAGHYFDQWWPSLPTQICITQARRDDWTYCGLYTETEMSFWGICRHRLRRKLSFWQVTLSPLKFLSKCVVGKGYVISCTYYISLAFAIGYYNVAPSHRYYGSIICYVERPIKDVPVVTGYILSCSNTNFHYNQEWKFDKLTTFIFHCQSLILLSVSSRLGRTYMDHQLIRPWEIWMRIWKWNFQSCFNDWYLQIFSW